MSKAADRSKLKEKHETETFISSNENVIMYAHKGGFTTVERFIGRL